MYFDIGKQKVVCILKCREKHKEAAGNALRDMGLGYEKIPVRHNDCMLFWNDNKDLDSCIKCGQSKWNDEVHLDDDGHPISASKKCPAKVLH